ncbi:LysR substrate-binding domain-containing protein [Usitatibacter palustris]|uniref:HTH-type transcriptional regulator GltC n=1 Tax=Usitatibacter palustris TaxID=2732487 RepID=A0A6M4H2P7_9PROT|nr:LysR substrate-binding domain-containing protein [Usitatibacter palustris]QJR13730.1 HTH-type transcriptional regulator GltC [Usitatibacter palustris]
MRPDFASLALFIAIAETRSITKAAQASHLALAAASRRISQLEEQLGARLLYRTARGVELTPAGSALLAHARTLMEQVAHMRADLSDYVKGGKGVVRVQANTSALAQFVPEDLASFARAFPAVRVSLEERRSSEIVQSVLSGATDVGIVVEGAPVHGLQCFAYRGDRLVVVLPRRYPLRGKRVAFARLLDHDFVGLESDTALSRLLTEHALAEQKSLRLRVQVKSFDVVARMIQARLGIGVLPETAARPFARALGLRLVPLSDPWAERRMLLCVRDYQQLPAIARQLVDHLLPK